MVGRGLLQEHFSKTFVKISAVTEINANFHLSHYKYMETLSCHSNESILATILKNIIYVEVNVMNICKVPASSSLWLLRRRFLNIFFSKI